jgi:hypothetical protein
MEIPEEAARRLVGPKADEYLTEWSRLGTGQRALGFSWGAFLFGPYWMLYRRMYRTCVLWMGAVFLWGITEALVVALLQLPQPSKLYDRAVGVGIGIATGIFGSYWYYLDIRRRYRRLALAGTPTQAALDRIGGVSKRAVWIAVAITVVLAILYALGTAAVPA